jgi:hypothetical protein
MRRSKNVRLSGDCLVIMPAEMRGPNEPTEFDLEVARLGLTCASEECLAANTELFTWARRWYRMKYIPERLLEKWGLKPDVV